MAYTDELQDILRALNSGMPAPDAYELFQAEQGEMQARRQARREAKMAQAQAMAEQQDALISALSGTAISEASAGSSLSDVLSQMAAQSSFMGVDPAAALSQPRVTAGLSQLFPPTSQAPWAPGVTPPLGQGTSGIRSPIASPVSLDADDESELQRAAFTLRQSGQSKEAVRANLLSAARNTYGTGVDDVAPQIDRILEQVYGGPQV